MRGGIATTVSARYPGRCNVTAPAPFTIWQHLSGVAARYACPTMCRRGEGESMRRFALGVALGVLLATTQGGAALAAPAGSRRAHARAVGPDRARSGVLSLLHGFRRRHSQQPAAGFFGLGYADGRCGITALTAQGRPSAQPGFSGFSTFPSLLGPFGSPSLVRRGKRQRHRLRRVQPWLLPALHVSTDRHRPGRRERRVRIGRPRRIWRRTGRPGDHRALAPPSGTRRLGRLRPSLCQFSARCPAALVDALA